MDNLATSWLAKSIIVRCDSSIALTPVFICDGPALPLRVEYDLPGSWETHIQSN